MAIPPHFINQLKDRLVLSEVIGQRVEVKRAGREYKACCPFHKENTPSFTINNDKQFYHCFGCGAHGGAIDFVMQHDNLSFIEAIEVLAAKANMEVPKQSPEEVKKAKEQKNLYHLLEDTTAYFEQQLGAPEQSDARQYLTERQIKPELASSFRIGFAPADGQKLYNYLKAKEYTDKQMVEAGVVRMSKYGKEPYAFFRDRVIFPVTDRRGRVVAFGGRIMPEHLRPPHQGDHKPPKYINSSDTPLFNKGQMLYGESHARQAAGDGEPVIVVEGYLDVIACFEAGYRGAVAPLGTAVTEEQILALWNMMPSGQGTKAPVLCFDGDNAGRRAAERACERLLPMIKADHSAYFAFLPEGEDPDTLIKAQGKDAFAKVLAKGLPMNEFIWRSTVQGRSVATPEERAGLEKYLNEQADRIQDRSVQYHYKQFFKQKLFDVFGTAKKNTQKSQSYQGRQGGGYNKSGYNKGKSWSGGRFANDGYDTIRAQHSHLSRSFPAGLIILAAVINHPWLFERAEEFLADLKIENERLDLLRQNVLNHLCNETNHDRDSLVQELSDLGYGSELETLLSDAIYTHAGFARLESQRDTVLEGWDEQITRILEKQRIQDELKEAKQALLNDFTEENEQRFLELQRLALRQKD